jgi:phosphoribosylaminoimidazole-succinocarboxamide synthase
MKKGKKLYEGKAKILYAAPEKEMAIQHFKDDATAFNNLKKSTIEGKGILNNRISEHILSSLNQIGIETHLIKRINMREQLIKLVEIIPIEFIVRNIATGSLTKRLGIEEGTILEKPLLEFFYKNDALEDPLIAREHIYAFNYCDAMTLDFITNQCFRVNDFLQGMFKGIGIKLVDFKLEFGITKKEENGSSVKKILLADEISPDTCRLWDATTDKKLDKDLFRKDLGNLIEGYQEVARRLGILHEHSNISTVKFTKPTAVKIKKK